MRRTGPIRFFVQGDEKLAAQYLPIARKIAGYLQNQADLLGDKQWTATRKVRITDGTIIDVQKIGELLYNAYIDVRGALPGPIIRALQYQFVYTGGAGKLWDVYEVDSLPLAGGSTVGVVFIIREDRVNHVAVPLVSTLLQPPDDEWVYLDTLATPVAQQALFDSLLIPRYEVVHATSQHLFQPDEDNIVHSAWMPKGVRHYMAGAFAASTMRQSGNLNLTLDPLTTPQTISPTDNVEVGSTGTDVGYETDLARYIRPTGALSEFQAGPKKGTHENSAADADWYTSYAIQEAELPNGETRLYGIFIDAAQVVHAWPLEAAGTGSPDPAYTPQLIKTNVGALYVKSQALVFPADVYAESLSFRDTFTGFGDNFGFDGPFENATRYVWHPKSDGTEFVTIVERLTDDLYPVRYTGELVVGADPYTVLNDKPHRCSTPAPARVRISVQPFSDTVLQDFNIVVEPVEVILDSDTIYPVQVKYASTKSFTGVEKDTILVAGFRTRRVETAVDDWSFLAHINGDGPAPGGTLFPDYFNLFNCHAIQVTSLPVLLDQGEYYNDNDRGTTYNDGGVEVTRNGHYQYILPRYAVQDMPFTRLGEIPDPLNNLGQPRTPVLSEVSKYRKSFVLEAEFVVRTEDEEVFTVCCRKFKDNDNEFDFGNFFTARISACDLSTGSFVFGLCESTTWVSSVEGSVARWPEGFFGDWGAHSGANSSTKGFAAYHHGSLSTTNNFVLANQLNVLPDTAVVPKDMSFWGCLRPARVLVQPPTSSGQYSFSSFAFNTNYLAHVSSLPVNQQELLQSFYYGFRDFPWGLEMASWVAANHFTAYGSQQVTSGEDLFAYAGAYLDITSPVIMNPLTNELINNPTAAMENIDVLEVAGFSFSHAELYEEAFEQPAELTFNINTQSLDRSPENAGYPIRKGQNSWDSALLYAPLATAGETNGGEEWAVNLTLPDVRVYCETSGFPTALRFFDYEPSQAVAVAQRYGLVRSPFQARCFSRVNIEE